MSGVLTLNFDNANDTIEVTQDQDTISVHYEDNHGHTGTFTFTAGENGLDKLVINSGGGSDSVSSRTAMATRPWTSITMATITTMKS